ncbi:methyl-accepting chemotaxis protein [Paludibacterium purpuratum]|uniref:Methyl-accepting chemotaxis sensory transducer with Cache sensor n=1 Tax=Paludibacterium purpuratum TaxID=1144873 RepID=A0A4R7AXR8_9NEIS|nr:methyl-accepting chemotaxis protein [Paludibacterium purpuratum]TDR72492.1 methyl-accepting chemotaxis sensory transducer with Cache sensor [Paludibacterium purpuratum]
MSDKKWGRLSTRITLVTGLAVAAAFIVMIGLISWQGYRNAVDMGYQLAQSQARNLADSTEADFRLGYALPKHLAQVVAGIKRGGMPERKMADNIHLELLDNAPQSVGLWMLWEPNAFDGNDKTFRFNKPYEDLTGRYTPYFTRNTQGKAQIDTMLSGDYLKELDKFKDKPDSYSPPYEKTGWGDFYMVPKTRNRDTITEPYPYDVQGVKVLESSLAVAVKDAGGKFLGVSATDVALGDLQKRFSQIHPSETGYVRMISEGGLYVVNPKAEVLGKGVEKENPLSGYLDKIKNGEPFVYEADGFTHFFQPVKVADTGQYWSLGVSVPTSAITAPALHQSLVAAGIGVVALVAIILLLAGVTRALTRPLDKMAASMEQLALGQGDLTVRINISNNDEIGRSAVAFNQFMQSLSGMFTDIRNQSLAVSQAASHLADSAGQVEQATSVQSDAASATAAGVEQVTVSVHHIADTAKEAENLAQQTGELTGHSVTTVDQVSSEIKAMNQSMYTLAEHINSLGARSEEVSSIINVIKDIADQTNLLALNAAIEAARAGEMGRGFAVVADEVRKLAGRSAEATVEISRIVTTIGNETRDAVTDVSGTRERVDLSVKVAEEANEAMRSVLRCNQDLAVKIGEIAASTREQSNASSEIAQNVERISNMAQSNSQVVHEVSDSVQRLRELAASLERLVSNFKL